jgi:CDGSH-type Zn-finger protein
VAILHACAASRGSTASAWKPRFAAGREVHRKEEEMAGVTIKACNNGPYEVSGAVDLIDYEGARYTLEEPPIYLCRCGRSANKPFCDGTHKKVGFQAMECVRQSDSR